MKKTEKKTENTTAATATIERNTAAAKKTAKQTATKKAEAEVLKTAAEGVKGNTTTAAEVGTATTAAARMKTINAARKDKALPAIFRAICGKAAEAHRAAATGKYLVSCGIDAQEAAAYVLNVSTLYTAAARYAEAVNGGNTAAQEAADKVLYTEWRGLLRKLAGEKTAAAKSDAFELYRAAVKTARAGQTFTTKTAEDGTIRAVMKTGTAYATTAAFTAFQREVERLAVDRILRFDGIVNARAAAEDRKAAQKRAEKARKAAEAEAAAREAAEAAKTAAKQTPPAEAPSAKREAATTAAA